MQGICRELRLRAVGKRLRISRIRVGDCERRFTEAWMPKVLHRACCLVLEQELSGYCFRPEGFGCGGFVKISGSPLWSISRKYM